jgi:ADP-heptose:LPS heptosyltransferase
MACALGVPLVVLFGPSDHVIWAPWKPVAAEQVVREVITDITAGEVIRAIDQLKVRA